MGKGLVIIFTGNGKGKTSAALGIALRAFGHGMRVAILQFLKGRSDTGEKKAADRLAPQIELTLLGKGFVMGRENNAKLDEHRAAAREALLLAQRYMAEAKQDVLVLDEINNAVHLGLIDITAVLELIKNKPEGLHLVLTGRDAHPDLIAAADMVTEMRSLKHPYDAGIPARKGIDY